MFTISEECRYRIDKVKEILDEYDILEEDKEKIISEIKEGWYQAHEAFACGRALENLLKIKGIKFNLREYIRLEEKEKQKYPFNIDEDEDEDEEI